MGVPKIRKGWFKLHCDACRQYMGEYAPPQRNPNLPTGHVCDGCKKLDLNVIEALKAQGKGHQQAVEIERENQRTASEKQGKGQDKGNG